MHSKGEICFTLWCKNSRRRETRIIDKDWIFISFPPNGVRRIRNYGIKWLLISMPWMQERISMCDIKVFIIDIMEKHIDTTEIIGSNVDLLTIESLSDIFFS